jgi:hypothetical protein
MKAKQREDEEKEIMSNVVDLAKNGKRAVAT